MVLARKSGAYRGNHGVVIRISNRREGRGSGCRATPPRPRLAKCEQLHPLIPPNGRMRAAYPVPTASASRVQIATPAPARTRFYTPVSGSLPSTLLNLRTARASFGCPPVPAAGSLTPTGALLGGVPCGLLPQPVWESRALAMTLDPHHRTPMVRRCYRSSNL
jgi:hypothetical protein